MESSQDFFVFSSHYRHSVDDKGRVAIPKGFRKAIPPESNGRLVLSIGHDNTIEFHPLSAWKHFEMATLSQFNKDDPEARQKTRAKLSLTIELEMDSAYRVLVPKYLLEYAKLTPGMECVFRGMGRYFELVEAGVFDALVGDYLNRFDEITDVKKTGSRGGDAPGMCG